MIADNDEEYGNDAGDCQYYVVACLKRNLLQITVCFLYGDKQLSERMVNFC